MIHRILIYIFPLILFGFQQLLSVTPVIGSSLAAGALGLLVPLTTPKECTQSDIPDDVIEKLRTIGLTAVSGKDRSFSTICLIFLLIFLVVWAYLAKLSVQQKVPILFGTQWPWDVIIGTGVYIVAATLREVKESF